MCNGERYTAGSSAPPPPPTPPNPVSVVPPLSLQLLKRKRQKIVNAENKIFICPPHIYINILALPLLLLGEIKTDKMNYSLNFSAQPSFSVNTLFEMPGKL